MAYQALARKYRPQTFSDIIGQESTVRTLQNAIEQNRLHHAYLFSGVRGVGKTTSARILAKAINCQKGPAKEPCNECVICREITEGIDLDVREIDAATYSKAEDVRDLRELMQFQPARDRKRIFIIDEVHSLSGQAWNALLKQIEEPPPHVVFMMATTEMQKVPATILSRVQQFALRKITLSELVQRLAEICRTEGIAAENEALEIIARRGEGSVRDALSLLDQVIAFAGHTVNAASVATVLGLSEVSLFADIVAAIGEGDHARILELLEDAAEQGRDFKLLYRDLLGFLRNLLLVTGGAKESLLPVDPQMREALGRLKENFDYTDTLRILNVLLQDDELVTRSEQQRLAAEVVILKAATFPRLRAIESAIGGSTVSQTQRVDSPSRQASPAPRTSPPPPSAPARKATTPEQDVPASGQPGDFAPFLAAVQKHRRMTATYVDMARRKSVSGDTVVLEFAPTQKFEFEAVSTADQVVFLEQTAREVFGRPMRVQISLGNGDAAGPKGDEERSPLSEDPVIKSLSKHLGGEVVAPRGKRPTEAR